MAAFSWPRSILILTNCENKTSNIVPMMDSRSAQYWPMEFSHLYYGATYPNCKQGGNGNCVRGKILKKPVALAKLLSASTSLVTVEANLIQSTITVLAAGDSLGTGCKAVNYPRRNMGKLISAKNVYSWQAGGCINCWSRNWIVNRRENYRLLLQAWLPNNYYWNRDSVLLKISVLWHIATLDPRRAGRNKQTTFVSHDLTNHSRLHVCTESCQVLLCRAHFKYDA